MLDFILWYLLLLIVGLITIPVSFAIFPRLPDRGYSFIRPLGLLLWGFGFWLLGSFGILKNNSGGYILSFLLVLIPSLLIIWKTGFRTILSHLKNIKKTIIWLEIIFFLTFAAWAIVRASNPEALGTEKPMELAFINSILKSETIPPHDPWLSGYAISYYYFGYLIIGLLAAVAGTGGGVSFNLGLALVFSLSATGSYGLIKNLLDKQYVNSSDNGNSRKTVNTSIWSLLGPLFLLLVSNLEGFLHVLHSRGILWTRDASGNLNSDIWKWLDISDLNQPPAEPFTWVPERFWWWWRASRVIQDYDLAGNLKEIINEFPFFSFLLGDLHPHVLALPFALVVIGYAFNLFLESREGISRERSIQVKPWFVGVFASVLLLPGIYLLSTAYSNLSMVSLFLGIFLIILGISIFYWLLKSRKIRNDEDLQTENTIEIKFKLYVLSTSIILCAFFIGSIAFLNTWDTLAFVVLFGGVYLAGIMTNRNSSLQGSITNTILFVLLISAGGILLFLPFYMGFSSQAGGIIPNLIYITRGVHFWVMFAPLIVPVSFWIIYFIRKQRNDLGFRSSVIKSFTIAGILFLLLLLLALILGFTATLIPQVNQLFLGSLAAFDRSSLFVEAFVRRITGAGGWITMFLLLSGSLILLLQQYQSDKNQPDQELIQPQSSGKPLNQPGGIFILLLFLLGLLLVIGPEFVFLRDQFGWRINTIFKFYYQTWLLWSIAAAYSSVVLFNKLAGAKAIVWKTAFTLLVLASLVYPVLSLLNKTNSFQPEKWTLDASDYLSRQDLGEYEAIEWLGNQTNGVIAEAVSSTGGSYTGYARMATFSGQPAVLGWIGHESQWRGGSEEMGTRQPDLNQLFCSRDWDVTKGILDKYQIRYIVVGPLERSTYQKEPVNCPTGLNQEKFDRNLSIAFDSGSTVIYEYSP